MKYKLNQKMKAKHDFFMNNGTREFTKDKEYSINEICDGLYYLKNDHGEEHLLLIDDMDLIFCNSPSEIFDYAMGVI